MLKYARKGVTDEGWDMVEMQARIQKVTSYMFSYKENQMSDFQLQIIVTRYC
jgi:hypothetical protein